MDALVGADGNRAGPLDQGLVAAFRQGLLDQQYARRLAGCEEARQIVRPPGLVGVDNEVAMGRGGAHSGEARLIAHTAQLQLQEGLVRMQRRLGRHGLRRAKGDGEGGDHRRQAMQPRYLMSANAQALGLEIPQGAVNGVAGRPGGQETLQSLTLQPGLQGQAKRLDGRHNASQGLAEAGIGHAFPPPAKQALVKGHGHHLRHALGAPRDDEGGGEVEPLYTDLQAARLRY